MHDSHKQDDDKLNLRTIIKISPVLLLFGIQLIAAWFAFQYFGAAKYKAMELVKNPNNIREGCAFYKNNIKGLIIGIDDYSTDLRSFYIKNAPVTQKSKLFTEDLLTYKDRSKCYKVKYVVVKIFLLIAILSMM